MLLMTLLNPRNEGPMKYLPSFRLSVCPFLRSFYLNCILKFSDILHGVMLSNLKSDRFGWFKNNLVLRFSGQKDESKWGYSSLWKIIAWNFSEFLYEVTVTNLVLRFLGQTVPKWDENKVFQVLWDVYDQIFFHFVHSVKVAVGLKLTLMAFSGKILRRGFWARSGRKGPKMKFFKSYQKLMRGIFLIICMR